MALPSTLHRFQLEVSDVDRGVYQPLDLRVALHPSESHAYLLTRVLAYALEKGGEDDPLEFSPEGLSDPEVPALRAATPHGEILKWIEIGNPGARKLHKAGKAAREVKIYTYKDPEPLLREIRENKVYAAERLAIVSVDPRFLEALAARLERKVAWAVLHQEGSLTVSGADFSESTELLRHPVHPG